MNFQPIRIEKNVVSDFGPMTVAWSALADQSPTTQWLLLAGICENARRPSRSFLHAPQG